MPEWGPTIDAIGIPRALVLCGLLFVGKWAVGQALTWLGTRLDKVGAVLGPHVVEILRLKAQKLHLEVEGLRALTRQPDAANNSADLRRNRESND